MCLSHSHSHADVPITCSNLANLFGLEDDSYGHTLAVHGVLLTHPELHPCNDEDTDGKVDDPELHAQWIKMATMTHFGHVLIAMEKPRDLPVWSEFCHLHLPAFIRAFRTTARSGHRTAVLGDEGPDEHVWLLFWLIVQDPLMGRFVREHPDGSTLVEDAMAYMSLVLRGWSARLERNRDWTFPFDSICGRMLLYLQALVFLIFTSVPSPSSPYPPAVLDSSAARVLLQDLNKFVRSFWSAPPRLRRTTFKNVIAQIERTAAQLALTLSQTLKCDCGAPGCERDANAMRRTLPWHRCEASLDGKGCNGKETEMMMCGKCRSVRYCSRAHQKAHWKMHKLACREPIW